MTTLDRVTNVRPHTSNERPEKTSGYKVDLAVCLVLLFAVALVFCRTPFDAAPGDDIGAVTWLSQAVKDPMLLFSNFWSPYMSGGAQCNYRPLYPMFEAVGYLLWQDDLVGYHVSLIVVQFINSCLLYFLTKQLVGRVLPEQQKLSYVWAFAAGLLFAVHPLHPETVSWIGCGFDLFATMFCLASLIAYVKHRFDGGSKWFAASLGLAFLAFLSKESAITFPAVVWSLDVAVIGGRFAIFRSWPFFAGLAAYFGARRLALGTFVGNYDNSLLLAFGLNKFVQLWTTALGVILVPANEGLVHQGNAFLKLWKAFMIVSPAMLIAGVVRNRKLIRLTAFFLLWFVAALIPVYKTPYIATDMSGTRYAYMCSVPLCLLLTLGPAYFLANAQAKWLRILSTAILATGVVAGAVLCFVNNEAWHNAGTVSRQGYAALKKVMAETGEGILMVFIGMPDNINGAPALRNLALGVGHSYHRPTMTFGTFDSVYSTGFLKSSLLDNNGVRVFSWNKTQGGLDDVSPKGQSGEKPNTLVVVPSAEQSEPNNVVIELHGNNVRCFDVDFVRINFKPGSPKTPKANMSLVVENDLAQDETFIAELPASDKENDAVFNLHTAANWVFGGQAKSMRLVLSREDAACIASIDYPNPTAVMPVLSYPHSGITESKGAVGVSAASPTTTVHCSFAGNEGVSRIDHCVLEVNRVNAPFATPNSRSPEAGVKTLPLSSLVPEGDIAIDLKDFPTSGLYWVRVRALDKDGHPVGLSSDPILVSRS